MTSTAGKPNFIDVVKDASFHEVDVLLWPELWKRHKVRKSDPTSWSMEKFLKQNSDKIPRAPGVYAFLIKPMIPEGLDHGVLIYVGKADKSIRDRYMHYLRQASDPQHGRPVVAMYLHKYEGYLHFAYAEMKSAARPSAFESRLITALIPVVNRQFPAKIRRVVNAFR
jgi:hypothetical protein